MKIDRISHSKLILLNIIGPVIYLAKLFIGGLKNIRSRLTGVRNPLTDVRLSLIIPVINL